ncbi:MAG: PHP domain-containing protein [Anaerolineae bacterium]
MILNLDLHTHTDVYSACSILSPDALCRTALERGLNALAITEHHYQWTPREVAQLQKKYGSLKLYAGVEISCTDGHDYVVLGLEPGPYRPHPMSYAELRALIDAHPGAFVFLAHPFRHNAKQDALTERALDQRTLDGIEMASYNLLDRDQPVEGPIEIVRAELREAWQQKTGWIPLCNSDGHSRRMVGTFYNQVETGDGVPPDEAALIQLLRRVEMRCMRDEALIRAAIRGRLAR